MSDLQCAATLLVARHAKAEYDSEFLSDAGGSLTVAGRGQAAALAESLGSARVAAIYCSGMARAVQTAEIVAARLGVVVRVRDALREWSVGEYAGQPHAAGMFDQTYHAWLRGDMAAEVPGGESGEQILTRMRDELASIADLHRGETVLVVSHGGVISFVVPRLAFNVASDYADGETLDNCAVVELAADADGWLLRSWAKKDDSAKPLQNT